MADPVATLREGLQDRYAFERELGRGGMATVWLARAIRLAARLQHPHILTVHADRCQ